MINSKAQLAAIAQEFEIDLPPVAQNAMASLLTRLEQGLAWPEWETDHPPSHTPEPEDHFSDSVTQMSDDIEEALSRARLANVGGAYSYIDDSGARKAVQKKNSGPLAGIPVAVKDIIAVAGRPLGASSAVREGTPTSLSDAPVVAALRQAGAFVIGTTVLHEFAFGVTGINDYSGTPRNPHDASRIPGGSSSGSAVAVAEGSARIAVGTDTGGSIRIPAALCGIVGFKPAFGTYPIGGVFPLSPTLDHVGFLARSVADIRRAHNVFSQSESGKNRPARVGLVEADLAQCDQTVQTRFGKILQLLRDDGCELVDITAYWPNSEDVFTVSTAIMFSEAAAIHKKNLRQHADRYGEDVRNRLVQGLAISAADYVMALRMRQKLQEKVQSTMTIVDCIIGPTAGIVAPKIKDAQAPEIASQLVAFTRLGNVVGLPAISLPLSGDGLPVGLHILSVDNNQTLKLASYFEELGDLIQD